MRITELVIATIVALGAPGCKDDTSKASGGQGSSRKEGRVHVKGSVGRKMIPNFQWFWMKRALGRRLRLCLKERVVPPRVLRVEEDWVGRRLSPNSNGMRTCLGEDRNHPRALQWSLRLESVRFRGDVPSTMSGLHPKFERSWVRWLTTRKR